jgi:thiamine transport system permease protein
VTGHLRQGRAPAIAALAFLGLALGAGFLPVLWIGASAGPSRLDSYIIRVLIFTLVQAGLSTALSIMLGLPVARAIARRPAFPGRTLIVRLLNLPLALPSIVVIIGIVEVYGAKGWLGGLFDIYGLQGIVLAHVFFNFPLAARLTLSEFERIPAESWKLAAQLGFGTRQVWRFIEWPQVRGSLPGVALLIFLLCASSFAIVLTLGGGPRATTLEVAIYQSLRADFDPQRAATLAFIQLALCASLSLLAQKWGGLAQGWPALRLTARRYDGAGPAAAIADAALILTGLLLLVPPLIALAAVGVFHVDLSPILVKALVTSLALGASSAVVAFAIVWPLAALAARSAPWRKATSLAVLTSWIVPPAVLATGWFVTLVSQAGIGGLAAFLVIAMNALMSLPFVHQALAPAVAQSAAAHDRLCLGLGISGWSRLRLVDLPVLKRPIGLALIMALILSLGDLTAISLFGTQDFVTLPALVYRQMGSYRFEDSIGTALVLGLMVLALSALAERWSGRP